MSNNPYAAADAVRQPDDPKRVLRGPAIGLIVVSLLSIACFSLTFAFSGFLIISGTASRMEPPETGISKEEEIGIRMLWTGVILVVNTMILVGSVKMLGLRNFAMAKATAILAVIPCIGPCYLLGIPFGIWALVVMHRPAVREAFR